MSPGREARILDAAGELLLLHGYRRVTIDDVARRADVGKGTIYLHYSSKLELFAAVLLRVIAEITTDHLTALRDDPGEVRLHRTMRGLFLSVMRRPLARAFYTGDTELLGALVTDTKIGVQFAAERTAMDPSYLSTLYAHGLLTDDPRTTPDLQYRYKATTSGFFLLDRLLPGNGDIGLEGRADALRPHRPAQLRADVRPSRRSGRHRGDRGDRAVRGPARRVLPRTPFPGEPTMTSTPTRPAPPPGREERGPAMTEAPSKPLHMQREQFDPVSELAAARDGEGVTKVVTPFGTTAYLVARYDDVRTVLSDSTRFSNAQQEFGLRGNPETSPDEVARMRAGQLLALDPPEHTRLRRMLTPEFTVHRMRRLEPRIREIVDGRARRGRTRGQARRPRPDVRAARAVAGHL